MMKLAPHGAIYCITNRINGKVYVGLTRRYVSDRWYQHKKAAARGDETALYRAIRKYGVDNFSIEHIASAISPRCLPAVETILIDQHGSYGAAGYNMSRGGEDHLDRRMSEEGKRRLKEARNRPTDIAANRARQITRMQTETGKQHQARMVEAARAAKDNLAAGRRAYAATDAGRAQIIAAAEKAGRIRAEVLRKPVRVGLRVFASVKDAAEAHGIERGAVRFRIKSPGFADWAWGG